MGIKESLEKVLKDFERYQKEERAKAIRYSIDYEIRNVEHETGKKVTYEQRLQIEREVLKAYK